MHNIPADSLSRVDPPSLQAFTTSSQPFTALWEALRHFYKTHQPTTVLLQAVHDQPATHPGYRIHDDLLLFKGRILVPPESALQPLLLHEYHQSPVGGHAGIQRTFARLSSVFYWPKMRQSIHDFIACCVPCQTFKPFNRTSQGLL